MTDKATVLLEEIGDGSLWLGGSGQHTDPLNKCQVAKENAPPLIGWCDTSYILQYDGTEFFQWHGRRADGGFHPYGKIMRLTEAGRAALFPEPPA